MNEVDQSLRDKIASRLGGEFSQLLTKMRESPPAVGDALAVPIDASFSAKNKIGSLGRMLLDQEPPLVKVGPLEIDRVPKYEVDSRTAVEWGVAFTHDRRTFENGTHLIRDVRWPTPLRVDNLNRKHLETSLFYHVQKKYTEPIMVVNPTDSTLKSFSKAGGGFATITNRSSPQIINDFKEKLSSLQLKNVTWRDPDDVDGVYCYLGSGEPKEFIGSWFRAVPSPFSSAFAKSVDVVGVPGSRRWMGTELRGRNESRVITFYWGEHDPVFSYNPATVNKNLMCGFGWIVQSSFDLCFGEEEDKRLCSTPIYLDNRPQEKVLIDDRVYTINSGTNEVVDVEGAGTYLSRRGRTVLPAHLKWAPFRRSPSGLYVSALCNHPILDSSIACHLVTSGKKGVGPSEFIGVGHSVPFLNPIMVEVVGRSGQVYQDYPRLVLEEGPNTLWYGTIPVSTSAGSRFMKVYLPDKLQSGAFAFQHDRGLYRDLIGETRRSLRVFSSGTTFVFINGYCESQSWTVVPGELDLYVITAMKNFFLSGVPALSSSSLGFKGRRAVPLVEVTTKYSISSWEESGFTISNIHHQLPNYSFNAISQNVASSRDILTLSDGTFIEGTKINVNFSGKITSGSWSGRRVGDLLQLISTSEKVEAHFEVFPDSEFLNLCRSNGIIFSFTLVPSGYDFFFRWPRFYNIDRKYEYQAEPELFG